MISSMTMNFDHLPARNVTYSLHAIEAFEQGSGNDYLFRLRHLGKE